MKMAMTLTAGGRSRGSTAKRSMMQVQKSSPPRSSVDGNQTPRQRSLQISGQPAKRVKWHLEIGFSKGSFTLANGWSVSGGPANGTQPVTLEHCTLSLQHLPPRLSLPPPRLQHPSAATTSHAPGKWSRPSLTFPSLSPWTAPPALHAAHEIWG